MAREKLLLKLQKKKDCNKIIFDVWRDWVPFVQLEKDEKHTWRSVTSSRSLQLY